ncbi:hypothetical protein CAE01nite_35360 [Cellulomonas aerilata]|uniref:Cell envelope-related transcriptional attenuator domain-containing protein n=1 Tax=Cellulomonas aerilata TaxID=515326 RepID=A0A512DH64_9CELL|nr:hypothetical protein CAE01nite_35360 [Cellulomonas aerilata]
MAERPTGREDAPDAAGGGGGSRARAGGSARPVGGPPRPTAPRDPRRPAADARADAGPSAPPPSFAPGGPARRAPAVDDADPVGTVPPRAVPARPLPPRAAPARQAGSAQPVGTAHPVEVPPRTGGPQRTGTAQPVGRPAVQIPPRSAQALGAPVQVGGAPVQVGGPARVASARPGTVAPGLAPGAGAPGAPSATPRAGLLGGHGERRRRLLLGVAVVAVLLLAWPVGLLVWANGKIQHVPALSGGADTPGITYLLAGSDLRGGEGGIAQDGTEGARTDTIMLLHVPSGGPAALISLPRDTLAEIPGQGANKLNAAYSWGGAPLLVETVEGLTGMHVDHYVEVGLGGVAQVVDAVGGVELCLDPAVNQVSFPLDDPDSGLVWAAPGCQVVDGYTSLAFARMRKADREGDIGRAKRQQQLIAALSSAAATPSTVLNPGRQVGLVSAGIGALHVSDGTDITDLGRLALAFRSASGPEGIRGTPPIIDADYRPGGIGSTVRLDPDASPAFFRDVMNGDLPAGPVGGVPAG